MKKTMRLLLGLLLVLTWAGIGNAEYPDKPITLLLGWPPGGNTDIIVRSLCDAAGKILGPPIVILNKPGPAASLSLVQLKDEAES